MRPVAPVKVVVLTTSYPRAGMEHCGRFVADGVARLVATGADVDVVGPASFRHYGLAYRDGVVRNVRKRPWAAPLLLASMATTVRRAAKGADLVHVHWLPNAAAALAAGKPFVVTLHGTDLVLAKQAPSLARQLLRRARAVIAVSHALAEDAKRLGARAPVVIPNGVDVPGTVAEADDPPHILYAGRLSPEKGIDELAAATAGLHLVVAGDGPLRDRVPQTLGFVAPAELSRLYERAAVVVCPSRREGFGVVCAEAMAHGRAVVASSVGGLLDLVQHEQTGLPVPPRNPGALRAALERLLSDAPLRRRLGAAARERVAALCSWDGITAATLDVYRQALTAPNGR
jgi:glycosyltransferase involved in cell wall biosynthesis